MSALDRAFIKAYEKTNGPKTSAAPAPHLPAGLPSARIRRVVPAPMPVEPESIDAGYADGSWYRTNAPAPQAHTPSPNAPSHSTTTPSTIDERESNAASSSPIARRSSAATAGSGRAQGSAIISPSHIPDQATPVGRPTRERLDVPGDYRREAAHRSAQPEIAPSDSAEARGATHSRTPNAERHITSDERERTIAAAAPLTPAAPIAPPADEPAPTLQQNQQPASPSPLKASQSQVTQAKPTTGASAPKPAVTAPIPTGITAAELAMLMSTEATTQVWTSGFEVADLASAATQVQVNEQTPASVSAGPRAVAPSRPLPTSSAKAREENVSERPGKPHAATSRGGESGESAMTRTNVPNVQMGRPKPPRETAAASSNQPAVKQGGAGPSSTAHPNNDRVAKRTVTSVEDDRDLIDVAEAEAPISSPPSTRQSSSAKERDAVSAGGASDRNSHVRTRSADEASKRRIRSDKSSSASKPPADRAPKTAAQVESHVESQVGAARSKERAGSHEKSHDRASAANRSSAPREPKEEAKPAALEVGNGSMPRAPFEAEWEVDNFSWPETSDRLYGDQRRYFRDAGQRLKAASGDGLNVLAITSPRRGDGKTTLALCLARCATEAGVRTALIDADFANPRLQAELGMSDACSWHEAIRGSEPLEEFAVVSRSDNLVAFPLSRTARNVNVSDLREPINQIIQRIASSFELAIVDLGSLESGGAELCDMAAMNPMNAVIVVRDCRREDEAEIDDAVARIHAAGVTAVGVAENFSGESADGATDDGGNQSDSSRESAGKRVA